MSVTAWSDDDSLKAKRIWIEYQRQHDLSSRIGQTAGIDPVTGRIWFGNSILDVVSQRATEGLSGPLYFERVGSDTYYQKGAISDSRYGYRGRCPNHCAYYRW